MNQETPVNEWMLDERDTLEPKAKRFASLDRGTSHICVLNKTGEIVAINRAWREYLYKNHPDPQCSPCGIGANYLNICEQAVGVGSEHAKLVAKAIRDVRGGLIDEFELEYPCHSPEYEEWYSVKITKFIGGDDNLFVVHDNVTHQKINSKNLKIAKITFEQAKDGIIVLNHFGAIQEVNPAFANLLNIDPNEIKGKSLDKILYDHLDTQSSNTIWQDLHQNGHWAGFLNGENPMGGEYVQILTVTDVKNEHGIVQGYVGRHANIKNPDSYRKVLEKIAFFDSSTGLPNRLLLIDRLRLMIAQATRSKHKVALVYIDLDGFKQVNDTHGHEAGDHVLNCVAKEMNFVMREGDTLARIGGDEFVAILGGILGTDDVGPVLKRLVAAVKKDIHLSTGVVNVTASMGVSFYPTDATDIEQLMRNSDTAMYLSKRSGKNSVTFYSEALHPKKLISDKNSRSKLGIESGEFSLFFQPKISTANHTLLGFEALARWTHPELGILSPTSFLSVLAEDGTELMFNEWVLSSALKQLNDWSLVGFEPHLSVNIDAWQLTNPNFFERLENLLLHYPASIRQRLEFELLETSKVSDMAKVAEVIHDCRRIGITFSLDDFGTGYCSLVYLRHLPVSTLKIDRSFIMKMNEDFHDNAIVEGVIGFAKAFKLKTVAEGVESGDVFRKLASLGCDYLQGYDIARPMPADRALQWAQNWANRPFGGHAEAKLAHSTDGGQ